MRLWWQQQDRSQRWWYGFIGGVILLWPFLNIGVATSKHGATPISYTLFALSVISFLFAVFCIFASFRVMDREAEERWNKMGEEFESRLLAQFGSPIYRVWYADQD